MQNDLISRSALMSHIESQSRQWGEDYDAEQILGDVEDFPVAYDVESVVQQLEDKTLETLGVTKEQFQMDKNEYKGYCSLSLYEVESVVRNGGKE